MSNHGFRGGPPATDPESGRMLIRPGPLARLLRLPAAVVILALLLAHAALWGRDSLGAVFGERNAAVALVVAYLVSLPLHEALHLLGYRRIGRAPREAVSVRMHGLVAYARCAVPLRAAAYRAAVALPGLALGVLPFVLGLSLGHGWLAAFGAFLTGGAVGDARVLWTLRAVPGDALVLFRPDLGAFEVTPPGPAPVVRPGGS